MSLEDAAREHGTPLYVYSRAGIEAAFRAYETAFAAVRPRICYAVKANGNGAILRLLAALGAGADIVSGGELLAARRAGFPAERIVFAGVGKTDAEIALGLEHGIGEWNAESEDEIARIGAAAASRGGRRPRLAARQPRHRPALAPLHLDRPARGQVRRRHREAPPRSCGAPGGAPGSRSWACSATSARRSPTSSRWRRPRGPWPA